MRLEKLDDYHATSLTCNPIASSIQVDELFYIREGRTEVSPQYYLEDKYLQL